MQDELARRRLLHFTRATFPNYEAGWFAREVCAELDWFLGEVRARRSPRLMLFAPPRHGKSELVSRRFPAFAMGQDPDLSIIATSYAADLASRMNRDVQRIIDSPAYRRIFPGTSLWGKNVRTVADGSFMRNSDLFEVVNAKGSYRSAGVGGGITGMGGDILIVDDPIKDAEQANSPVYRAKVWEWFTSTLYTRRMPGGGILIILTRWHQDDLAGRILDAAAKGEGEQYRIVNFPAVAEQDDVSVLDGRLLRREGEALHPERYSLAELEKIKLAVGSRVWASLYQQRPAAAEGAIFKREWWKWQTPTTDDPAQLVKDLGITRVVQFWDTGFKTGQENDPSVCLTLGETTDRYIVLDVWRQKVEFPDLKRAVPAHAGKWNPMVVLVEDKASGQSLVQELKRETRLPIVPIPVDRDKLARANAVTPLVEAGKVYLLEGRPWVADFVDELATFPNASHDDQVDAFDGALEYASHGGGGMGFFEYLRQEAEAAEARKKAGQDDGVSKSGQPG
jgi:predicted phage terminase large subunit-like protein